jgi:ATP-dependent Lon protease
MVGRSAIWASGRAGCRGEFQQAGSRASEKVSSKAYFSPSCFLLQRILLLTGPAGVGKSTSVRAIAEEMGVEVVEWNEGFEDWGFRGDIGKYIGWLRSTKTTAR